MTEDPAAMSMYSRVGRPRPPRRSREYVLWALMRVTGLALFVLALAHYLIVHFLFDPAQQTATWIIDQRWNQVFWRAFDWTLLMLVLFHGFMGMRTVIGDHVHRPRLRAGLLFALAVLGVFLFIIGTLVVFTLPVPGET
jgi:succinate dehydrogenase / fumarate reductase membrane anchor subunit